MADRSFNSIFVVIAICICCTKLDVVLLDTTEVVYYDESIDHGLAIQLTFPSKGPYLNITVFFETENATAKDFFYNDMIVFFEELTSCDGMVVMYSPCANMKFGADKKLTCPQKDNRCVLDRFISCVAYTVNNESTPMGRLLLCMFSTDKAPAQCAVDLKMDLDPIDKCCTDGTGDAKCLAFKNSFTDAQKKKSPSTNDIADFAETVCYLLRQFLHTCKAACG